MEKFSRNLNVNLEKFKKEIQKILITSGEFKILFDNFLARFWECFEKGVAEILQGSKGPEGF